jgi:hypothetical protein
MDSITRIVKRPEQSAYYFAGTKRSSAIHISMDTFRKRGTFSTLIDRDFLTTEVRISISFFEAKVSRITGSCPE